MTTLALVVGHSEEIAPGIRELSFSRTDGGVLPAHPAGSHVVVDCGEGRRNAYSLTNPGADPREYRIAVLHKSDGAGGSGHMHSLRVGDTVTVSRPRSAFAPVSTARRHLLVAGGIGITPMLAHARDAVRWGRDVDLIYVHRPGSEAFSDELAALLGDRLAETTDEDEFGRLLDKALTGQPIGTHLYVCGPGPLLDRVLADAAAAGWPPERLHLERFVPAALDPGREFVARLARSGRDVRVPSGRSLLDALHEAGVAVPNMCRQGVCGECKVPVLAGTPLHRDEFLADDERGAAVMCCVSRSKTETLEIDL
ncbi:PDR/VanB family oxidoreductase [Pseudonocardia halophobica]|uniref:Ferredoxin n=1 Tax=Pseudonocardia halophobica TaxID=29401 RepID=A0A9W6NWP8_9PSEU|nr:PDR/VanB family oxidoreductase [Pseudonocardia halophobica]GLL12595.1 ferredoxin [Pseudonocardia halophobica]